MKNNTSDLKICLQHALRVAPNDFALDEVRGLLSRAIHLVENVEKKRNSRQQNKLKREQKIQSVQNPWNVLQNIENELNNEKRKLEEMKNKKSVLDLPDNEELQNVFG